MKFFVIYACVLLLASNTYADPIKDNNVVSNNGFSNCLESDSISCLQLTLFRKAKSLFDSPQIDVIGGVLSLVKSNEGRQGKALEDNALAVEVAPTVEARNSEMSTYFMEHAKNFFVERSMNFNFANAARSVARAIPDDIKADVRELIGEARTKKKKLLKKFLPILLGVGAKLAVLAVGALFGLLFLAKKALVISVIAFFMALAAGAGSALGRLGGSGGSSGGLLGGLGGLFGGGGAKNAASSGSQGWSSGGASGGWSSGGGGGGSGWDSHGAYSSPVAQTIAYNGYKQARR